MGIKRKKQPITKTSSAVDKRPSLGKSSIATQSTISKYHTLLKRQTQLRKDLRRGFDEKIETDLAAIQKELDDLGGIQGYQQASKLGQDGQRGGDTSKIMVGWLLELQLKPTDGTKMR
jgi:25S rRNA (adenine2142-N1)-methyltransferase